MSKRRWRSPHDTHSHGQDQKERALLIALVLSGLAFVGQMLGFYWSDSLALLSDTMHIFTDLLSLGMAWFAVRLTRSVPSEARSFGLYRLEVLASFLNGALLLLVAIGIAFEAVERILHPQSISTLPLLVSAVLGLILNLLAAWVLHGAGAGHAHGHEHGDSSCGHDHAHEHSHEHAHKFVQPAVAKKRDEHVHADDRNLRSALLHVVSDALGSCAVIVGALLIMLTGKTWIDPIVSIGLALLVSYWSINIVYDTIHVLLESTPRHIDTKQLTQKICGLDANILALADLHVWEITSHMYALSAQVIVNDMSLREADQIRAKISAFVESEYGIAHPTLSMQPKEKS